MARWEFKLPDIGEGVTEGEIVGWLIKPGDSIKEDDPMVEIMTDKATVTITSPRAGTIMETRGAVGQVVEVHGVLVVFELGSAAPAERSLGTNGHTVKDEPAATAVGDIRETLPGMTQLGRGAPAPLPAAHPGYFNAKPLATPATRRTAREMSVDLRAVPPTGPQGRVTRQDVEVFARAGQELADRPPRAPLAVQEGAEGPAPAPAASAASRAELVPAAPRAREIAPEGELDVRVPFAGVRRKISEKMSRSVHTAAHFTFVEECDVTRLKDLRARLKPQAEAAGVKLSFLPFIVKACVCALKKHPVLNATLDVEANEIVYRKRYDIGIAASTARGLIVPVVGGADRRSLLDTAREIERLAADAKAGRSRAEDLTGSTFTITSLGAQGGLFATPIINFPEVAILGVHQIKQRPVVRDGQIVIGEVMLLSLSFDHRIVDGHVGAAFAYEIIGLLEDPDRLFLEMT